MNKAKILIGAFAGVLTLILVFNAFAGADEETELSAQVQFLEQRIAETKLEYSTVGGEKQEAQEYCNIVYEKEAQMRRLNELNNSRRSEIMLINQKLNRLTQALQDR